MIKRQILGAAVAATLFVTGLAGSTQADTGRVPDPRASAEVMAARLAGLGSDSPQAALRRLAGLAGATIPQPAPAAATEPAWLPEVDANLRPAIAALWNEVQAAQADVAVALAAARPGDVELARAAFSISNAIAADSTNPRDHEQLARLRDLERRVPPERLAAAAIRILDAAEVWNGTVRWPTRTSQSSCIKGDVEFESPDCSVVIGGAGPNTYARNVLVSIDRGGDDMYLNNSGANRAPGGVALAYDMGAGKDTYYAKDLVAQGTAVAGAGVLIDEGGIDGYTYQGRYSLPAQGVGLLGAGVLWDRGDGTDRYTSRNFSQGIGSVGYGMLLDEGGSDRYTIPYSFDSEGAQGSGCQAGAGGLVDQGSGDDAYEASIVDMQGMACLGAAGVLYDGGGSDRYLLHGGWGLLGQERVVQSGWGQGYGELGAIGVLLDAGVGNDVYEAEVRLGEPNEGRFAQGVSLLATAGYLLDGGGNDRFAASDEAQGYGATGLGVLLDRGGDDVYRARDRAQGSGQYIGGQGALIDEDGRDSYFAREMCQGSGITGAGLFLELGGDADSYSCASPGRNNDTWGAGMGRGIDR